VDLHTAVAESYRAFPHPDMARLMLTPSSFAELRDRLWFSVWGKRWQYEDRPVFVVDQGALGIEPFRWEVGSSLIL
jgi:hypothetical protein